MPTQIQGEHLPAAQSSSQPGLEHFRGGTFTATLDNLSEHLITLTIRNSFLIPNLDLLLFSFKPLPLVQSLICPQKQGNHIGAQNVHSGNFHRCTETELTQLVSVANRETWMCSPDWKAAACASARLPFVRPYYVSAVHNLFMSYKYE